MKLTYSQSENMDKRHIYILKVIGFILTIFGFQRCTSLVLQIIIFAGNLTLTFTLIYITYTYINLDEIEYKWEPLQVTFTFGSAILINFDNFSKLLKAVPFSDLFKYENMVGSQDFAGTLFKFILFLMISMIMELRIIFKELENLQKCALWVILFYPKFLSSVRLLEVALFVDVLSLKYRLLSRKLKQLFTITPILKANDENSTLNLAKKINDFKFQCFNLNENAQEVADLYSLSLLVIFCENFILLIFAFYNFYALLKNDQESKEIEGNNECH